MIAQAELFALGRLARRRAQEQIEDPLAHFLHRRGPVEYLAAVDVHVLFQGLEHGAVGREFDARRRLGAEHRTPSGGEGDQVGAARDLPGGGNRIEAGRVHEDEPLGSDRFGIAVHLHQRAGTALHRRAERLLENVGQPAHLVAGADLAVDLYVAAHRILVFPPADALDQLLADGAAGCAPRERVFHTVDLRCFGEDAGAAMPRQDIDGRAKGGIGGDRREAVGAAALQSHTEVAGGDGLPPHVVGLRQQRAHGFDAGRYGLAGAAGLLHDESVQVRAGHQCLLLHQALELVALAAQADHQGRREIGMARIAGHGPAQQLHRLPRHLHAAADGVAEGHHAVDIRKLGQPLGREPFGDLVDDRRRTVHGGQDADEIAGSDLAVGTHIALEGGTLGFGQQLHRLEFTGMGVLAVEFTELGVVAVDHRSRLDVHIRKAHGDVVLEDGLALEDFPGGDLVAGGHLAAAGEVLAGHCGADRHVDPRHHHVVAGVQADHGADHAFGDIGCHGSRKVGEATGPAD